MDIFRQTAEARIRLSYGPAAESEAAVSGGETASESEVAGGGTASTQAAEGPGGTAAAAAERTASETAERASRLAGQDAFATRVRSVLSVTWKSRLRFLVYRYWRNYV